MPKVRLLEFRANAPGWERVLLEGEGVASGRP